MKAAALAFVLLIGAAIVLAFANTLNSWVLGGLIGGLAALLLSIPISLALFTILARRHDEQLYAQEQEEEVVFDEEYAEVEADAYVLPSQDEQYLGLQQQRIPERRNQPAPSYPRLPAAGQSHVQSTAQSSYNQRGLNYPQGTQRPSQALSARGNGTRTPVQRLSPDGALPYTRNQPNSLAKHQTAALRAARREAAQGQNIDPGDFPTSTSMSRRFPARPSQPLDGRPYAGGVPRPTRQLPGQEISPNKPQRSIDASARQQTSARRYRPIDDEDASNRYPQTDALSMGETERDRLYGRLEQTGPLRRNPETGKITRRPQLGEQPRNPEAITGSLQNPLVRRPPYMYEDDPLREELAQFVERPITRRSSLKESWQEQED